jgi:Flp pilus assembly protein TadD
MKRLLFGVLSIAIACAAIAQQSKDQIPATTKSEEARRHFERGLSLSEHSRTSEAIEALRLALKVDPAFVSARALLGFHMPGEAGTRQIEQASQEADGLPEAECAFIRTLRARRVNDTKAAVAEARKLVALLPESPRAHVALGYALSGALDHAGGVDEARKAIALDARFGPALNLLGYELLQQGKVPEAIDALQKYAAVTPQEPNPQDSLGDAFLAAGRYADAEAAFRKAVEISPTFWNGFEGIACAKFYRGDFAGARQAFEDGRKVTANRPAERATLEQVAVFEALAEDKPDDAMKILDDIERIPNLTPDRLAILPVARAMVFLHSRKFPEAFAQLEKMTPLWTGGALPPPLALELRRYTLTVRSAVEATMNDPQAVTRTTALIRQDAAANPNDKAAQSALHFAMGMVAIAKGDRNGALREWTRCVSDDVLCRGYLAMAIQKPLFEAGFGYPNARHPIFLYLSSRKDGFRDAPGKQNH